MRKFLCLAIFAVAVLLGTQAAARSDKSIGHKCYKSYHNGRGNRGVACIYIKCQKKYEKHNITFQIQCQDTANKEFLDLVIKDKGNKDVKR